MSYNLYDYLAKVTSLSNTSMEAIVLQNGQRYARSMQPRPFGIRKARAGDCFRAAYYLAESRGWQYVEGFATSVIPIQHAWVIHPRGYLIETTWPECGDEYWGIPLDLHFMHQVMLETKAYGILNYNSQTFRKRFGIQ